MGSMANLVSHTPSFKSRESSPQNSPGGKEQSFKLTRQSSSTPGSPGSPRKGWNKLSLASFRRLGSTRRKLLDNESEQLVLEHPALRKPAKERTKDERKQLWDLCQPFGWFSRLSEQSGPKVFGFLEFVSFKEGEVVCRKGDISDGMYVLLQGTLSINANDGIVTSASKRMPPPSLIRGTTVSPQKMQTLFKLLSKDEPKDLIKSFGDAFGDWGLQVGTRQHTVSAVVNCSALFLNREGCKRIIYADMSHQDKIVFLRQVPLFARAGKSTLDKLASLLHLKECPPKTVLASEGTEASGIFIVGPGGSVAVVHNQKGARGDGRVRESAQTLLENEKKPPLDDKSRSLFKVSNVPVSILGERMHFGVAEIVKDNKFQSTYVTLLQCGVYTLSRAEMENLLEHHSLGWSHTELTMSSKWHQERTVDLDKSIVEVRRRWGKSDLVPPESVIKSPPKVPEFQKLAQTFWGTGVGDMCMGLANPHVPNAIHEFHPRPTTQIGHAINTSGYTEEGALGADSAPPNRALFLASARVDPHAPLMETATSPRVRNTGEITRGWRRVPGTNFAVPPPPVQIPVIDLHEIRRGEHIPPPGYAPQSARELAQSLREVVVRTSGAQTYRPDMLRLSTPGLSREGQRGEIVGHSQGGNVHETGVFGEHRRRYLHSKGMSPRGSVMPVQVPLHLGDGAGLGMEHSSLMSPPRADPLWNWEVTPAHDKSDGVRAKSDEVYRDSDGVSAGDVSPSSLPRGGVGSISPPSFTPEGFDYCELDDDDDDDDGGGISALLINAFGGQSMGVDDTVRYLFRGLAFTDVELRGGSGVENPTQVVLTFHKGKHAAAAKRRAESLDLTCEVQKKSHGLSKLYIHVKVMYKSPSTKATGTESHVASRAATARTAENSQRIGDEDVNRSREIPKGSRVRKSARASGVGQHDGVDPKALRTCWSNVLPHIM